MVSTIELTVICSSELQHLMKRCAEFTEFFCEKLWSDPASYYTKPKW